VGFRGKVLTQQLIEGDCLEEMQDIAPGSVNLIMTSPPYADQRKNTYGGVSPDKYIEWFMPIADEMQKVLSPTGTLILNIKEKVTNGERNTYVLELILEMRKHGWLWTEEYIWHKKNAAPGKWPNRFRDSWERLLQFNKCKKFDMYQDEVMIPRGEWGKTRLAKPSKRDHYRTENSTNSGFGSMRSNWANREFVYPTNVLHLACETGNQNHSAVYPLSLPTWFIKLFTKEGDTVLDPFMGSGTTGQAASQLKRHFIGIEKHEDYYQVAKYRLGV
jgi:site-specific DNA-methyltransferase (adenine-specific)